MGTHILGLIWVGDFTPQIILILLMLICFLLSVVECVRGIVGCWIDPASCSSQCFTTVVQNVVVCTVLFVGMVHVKGPLLLVRKRNPWTGGSGFPLQLSQQSLTISPVPNNHK